MRQDNPQLPFDNFHPYLCVSTAGLSPEPEPSEPSLLHFVSEEGDVFSVYREHALASETIRTMLAEPNTAVNGNMIYFPDIPSHVMQQICMYFEYEERANVEEDMNMGTWLVPVFVFEAASALDLLSAAIFFNY